MPNAPEPKEIRELYSDYESEWSDIQDDAQTDRRYAAGDPWEEAEKRARENRPCVSHDEISQYLNQYLNNLRQNKRAIKVTPAGYGASDQHAEHRQNIIRAIEYRSKAQQAYICAADNAVVGGYGFAKLTTDYVDDETHDQEIRIKRIALPDSILIDPDFREADASDMQRAFEIELLTKEDFKRRFPGAKIQGFTGEHYKDAPGWIQQKYVQVAKLYWVHKTEERIVIKGRERTREKREVVAYFTNGLEILKEEPWPGSYIPILPCFGKEMFLEEGGGPKRHLISMVRLARDPQKTLAYLVSQEMEEAGLTPKATYIGYKGQFESDAETWETITKVPHAYVQADILVDGSNGQILPLPQRQQFTPNFQAYEVAKESARRAIQSAMGISPLPTAAQRQNQKSGVALERISTQEAIGSFHFTDNFDRFLENAGRQINELIKPIIDTQREVPAIKNDETPYVVLANHDPESVDDKERDNVLKTDEGRFDVTVSTGPSYQSQREAAQDFVDVLVQNLQSIPAPPPVTAKILSLAIKLKDLGPIGDQISEMLSPPENDEIPPQAQAAIAQAQGQVQLLSQELQKLQFEKQAKVVDNEYDLKKQHEDNAVKIAVAEIQTKAQIEQERQRWVAQLERELWMQGSQHAHDYAMQAHQQQHEQKMGEQSASLEMASQANQQAHESDMAQQQQENQPNE